MASTCNQQVYVVDLRSDTVTKPTLQMKQAMVNAELGDDVFREDPTVIRLEKMIAKIVNKEAALFVPSGTMANLIAAMVHCSKRGAEAILGDKSHMFLREQGGLAQIAGIQSCVLHNQNDGTLDIEEVKKSIRDDDVHKPYTGLICIENTHNACGGKVLPQDYLRKLYEVAQRNNIPVHMDGSRLFNAAAHLNIAASQITQYCDSVSVCFSKSLCAPIGSVVAGSRQFIDGAIRMRKLLGGGMRQVGVLAAAAIVSLETIVEKLPQDHIHAKLIAKAITEIGFEGVRVADNETNMVFLKLDDQIPGISAIKFAQRLRTVKDEELLELKMAIIVKVSTSGTDRVRCVLHPNLNEQDVDMAIRKLQFVIKEIKANNK